MLKKALYKVKKGKLDTLKTWFRELKKRKDEVKETFVHEDTLWEAYYLFDNYVLALQEVGENHRPADMDVELNRKHFEVLKDCLEYVEVDELFSA